MKTTLLHIGILIIAALTADWAVADSQGNATRGAGSWANNCARCHNMRGPTEFEADLWVPITFHMRVRAGLTGQQTRDIIAFLQQSTAQPIPQAAAASTATPTPAGSSGGLSGADVYASTCVACHGDDGTGVFPGVPDFTAQDSPLAVKTAAELLDNMAYGFQTTGSPMAMPAKGGNPALTQQDLESVLVYLNDRFR